MRTQIKSGDGQRRHGGFKLLYSEVDRQPSSDTTSVNSEEERDDNSMLKPFMMGSGVLLDDALAAPTSE